MQLVSGANIVTFWAVSLLWDYLTFIVTVGLTIATIAACQLDGWISTPTGMGILTVTFLLFGFAVIPVSQVASFLFGTPSSGYSKMTIINLLSIPGILIVKGLLEKWVFLFRIFPQCALAECLTAIVMFNVQYEQCIATHMCGELMQVNRSSKYLNIIFRFQNLLNTSVGKMDLANR